MALEDSNSAFLRRLGGPTSRQIAMDTSARNLAQDDRRQSAIDIYSQGKNTGIIQEKDGEFLGIDFDKLFEEDQAGNLKNASFIPQLLNSTKTFGQFLDTEVGTVKQGKVVGFAPGSKEGTVAILNERPDTKVLRPKTWFATDDPQDYTAELTEDDVKKLMYANVATLYHRAYGKRKSQSDRVIEQADNFNFGGNQALNSVGSKIAEIDDSDAPLPDRNQALLDTIESIDEKVAGYNLQAEESRNQFGSVGKDVVVNAGQRSSLPMATQDTSSEGAQTGYATANAILNADPNTAFTVAEVENMYKSAYGAGAVDPGVIKVTKLLGISSTEGSNWKRLPELLQRKEFLEGQSDDYTEKGQQKRSLITGGTSSITGASMGRGPTKTKAELIAEVDKQINKGNSQLREAATLAKAEYERDDASIKRVADEKIKGPIEAKLKAVNAQLNQTNVTLSEGKRKELEAEKIKLEKQLGKFALTSVEGIEPLTDLPEKNPETGDFDVAELENWFRTNEKSLMTVSEDGATANKVKELIKNYDVESLEDMQTAIASGAAEKENLSVIEVGAILAKTSGGNFETDLQNYVNLFGGEQDRQLDRSQIQQTMAIQADEYRMGVEAYYNKLGDPFIELNDELITALYGDDGEGKYDLFDEKQQATLRKMATELENLPGAPKFKVVEGKVTLQSGATKEIDDSVKTYVGQLFKAIVETEGSVDFMDGWGDFFAPNDPRGLARLIDEIQFTRNPNGSIREIFFTPSGSNQEAEGSIKPSELNKYFGSSGNYQRNLLLAYISQHGKEKF